MVTRVPSTIDTGAFHSVDGSGLSSCGSSFDPMDCLGCRNTFDAIVSWPNCSRLKFAAIRDLRYPMTSGWGWFVSDSKAMGTLSAQTRSTGNYWKILTPQANYTWCLLASMISTSSGSASPLRMQTKRI
uniref:Uncharacterized protein n=1 Tax=Cacopsylla melanoneura TaxID=428564 RepID=A0A8D8M754_9HEMI